jgi:hypothetical protein
MDRKATFFPQGENTGLVLAPSNPKISTFSGVELLMEDALLQNEDDMLMYMFVFVCVAGLRSGSLAVKTRPVLEISK